MQKKAKTPNAGGEASQSAVKSGRRAIVIAYRHRIRRTSLTSA